MHEHGRNLETMKQNKRRKKTCFSAFLSVGWDEGKQSLLQVHSSSVNVLSIRVREETRETRERRKKSRQSCLSICRSRLFSLKFYSLWCSGITVRTHMKVFSSFILAHYILCQCQWMLAETADTGMICKYDERGQRSRRRRRRRRKNWRFACAERGWGRRTKGEERKERERKSEKKTSNDCVSLLCSSSVFFFVRLNLAVVRRINDRIEICARVERGGILYAREYVSVLTLHMGTSTQNGVRQKHRNGRFLRARLGKRET